MFKKYLIKSQFVNPEEKIITFNPETDFIGFESRVNGSGFELDYTGSSDYDGSDLSYEEKLPPNHHRVVSCYDMSKDKWQTVGITDWVWVGEPTDLPTENRESILAKRKAQHELHAKWEAEMNK